MGVTASRRPRRCRICGCTDHRACVQSPGMPCCWIEDDLCSACVDGDLAIVGCFDLLAPGALEALP